MLGIVVVMVAVLYYATPNVRQPKFRWVSVGAAVAILGWVLASVAFGFYVSNFGSYNKTYGSLAGIIVFLLWLWITNLALLFGAEVDAELERARELQSGIEAERTLQLPPRDTRNSEKAEEKLEKRVAEGRRLRLELGCRRGEWRRRQRVRGTGVKTDRAGHRTASASAPRAGTAPLGAGPRTSRAPFLRPPTAGPEVAGQRRSATGAVGTYASAVTLSTPGEPAAPGTGARRPLLAWTPASRPGAWATSGRPTTRCCPGRSP